MARAQLKTLLYKVLSFMVLILSLSSESTSAVGQDKFLHGGFSLALGSSCSLLAEMQTRNPWISGLGCFLLVNAIGFTKEMIDPSIGGQRDINDGFANAVGSGIGVGVVTLSFEIFSPTKPQEEIRPFAKADNQEVDQSNSIAKLEEPIEVNPNTKSTRFALVNGKLTETPVN